MDNQLRKKYGYWEGGLSIFFNIILFLLKYFVGIQTKSIALIADAWHTLSDSFSSFILLFGFKISSKPADQNHPYGHGRAELIASIIIGTILAVVGLNFLVDSIKKFAIGGSANFNSLAILITIISIAVKEGLAQFAFFAAKKADSPLIKADGWHHRSDALSSVLVLVGIFLGSYFWWIDSLMGVLISFLLFHASYDIIKTSVDPLLGQSADSATREKIIKASRDLIDQEINIHHIHCHNYGNHKEITFHIMLPGDLTLRESHRIADKIETMIRKQFNMEATIHVDPFE